MNLPPELLDEIFSYLPPDDRELLRVCSLMARPWVCPAQRRLFSSVAITLDTHRSWKDCIPPVNLELLSHVRLLRYFARYHRLLRWNLPRIEALINYLPSFCHLQSLTLRSVRIKPDFSKRIEIFPAFQHTLSFLSLRDTSLPWTAFVALIDYFPYYLEVLEIRDLFFLEDRQQQTPLSKPPHGHLSINMFTNEALATFSDRLCGIQVVYGGLADYEDPIPRRAPGHYQQLIDACGKSLDPLKLSPCECTIQRVPARPHRPHRLSHASNFPTGVPLALSRCPGLCLLKICVAIPGKTERAVISSIISTNVHAIVFAPQELRFDTLYAQLDNPCWQPLDGVLCGLVDKLHTLGYNRTLELEVRLDRVSFGLNRHYNKEFLPKFREKFRPGAGS